MKTMKPICWLTSILIAGAVGANGGQFRTDINPALRYYQAFIVAPDLSEADRDYLFMTEWRGQKLPERFGELVARYDNEFKFVRQAAQASVACDWGIGKNAGQAPHK